MYAVFERGAHRFGILVEHLQEVIRTREIKRLPFLKTAFSGILRYGNTIVGAVDLQKLVQDDATEEDQRIDGILIIQHDGNLSAIPATEIRLAPDQQIERLGEARDEDRLPFTGEQISMGGETYPVIEVKRLYEHLGIT